MLLKLRSQYQHKRIEQISAKLESASESASATKSETEFFNFICTLNRICRFFGVTPIFDSCSAQNNRCRRRCRTQRQLHYIWYAILIIFIHAVNYYCTRRVHSPLLMIVKLFFFFELIYCPFIVFYIIITVYTYALQYRKIPNELLRIHKQYKSFQMRCCCCTEKDVINVLHKELQQMLGIFGVVMFGSLLTDYYRTDNSGYMLFILNSCVFNLPNIFISLNLGQYWLALRFIYHLQSGFNGLMRERLKECSWNISKRRDDVYGDKTKTTKTRPTTMMNDDNEETFAFTRTNEFSWFKREFNYARAQSIDASEFLDAISRPYFDLENVKSQLTQIFGGCIFLNVIGSVVSLSVECFAIYKYLEDNDYLGDELSQIYHRFLWIGIHVGRILLILVTNDAIIEEKCRTTFILNSLYISSRKMERTINQFLLRLMIHNQTKAACGIVQLDSLIITGLIGTIANYIIFLIQIDLGTATLSDLLESNVTKLTNKSDTNSGAKSMKHLLKAHL